MESLGYLLAVTETREDQANQEFRFRVVLFVVQCDTNILLHGNKTCQSTMLCVINQCKPQKENLELMKFKPTSGLHGKLSLQCRRWALVAPWLTRGATSTWSSCASALESYAMNTNAHSNNWAIEQIRVLLVTRSPRSDKELNPQPWLAQSADWL